MISASQFDLIRTKHGGYASWALWAPASGPPKSNVGDLGILDPRLNAGLLEQVRPNVIMVGLNISRTFSEPFRNFHDASPRANDFKIRYAFHGTPYYGAYMTDVIKNVEMVKSTDLLNHLAINPRLLAANVAVLREELRDLASVKPTILAFGHSTYELLVRSLDKTEYSALVRLMHYSHRIAKEHYRDAVLSELGLAQDPPSPT